MLLYADHVEGEGVGFFRLTCEQDLDGVAAKLRAGAYGEHWYKIRNQKYSQYEGRSELFEKRVAAGPSSRPSQGVRSASLRRSALT